ncbi:NADH dehydrogenase (ubiquinone) 15 kDa subunit [Brevipalpus obovatus]|uniref:NADH dehydrogenase (ubiquinone) 15 kDa subunit n=1 Tax=Brevipalpus obovatus TaxID=246614 RepID=UPI003D9F2A0A
MSGVFNHWVMDEFNMHGGMNRRRAMGYDKCANIQLNWAECMEAYGRERGDLACKLFYEDLQECIHGTKQILRQKRLKAERWRQVLDGERKYSDLYSTKQPTAASFPYIKPSQ